MESLPTNLPKISVITPSYNQGQFIEKTIRSVLGQGYPNFEYFVIDGGSSDGTIAILKKYNGALTWISEADRGQAHAINKGLKRATGEIVAYLNSDDVYEPGILHLVGKYFSENKDIVCLTGKCRIVDEHGQEIRKLITAYKNLWMLFNSYTVLLILNYISQPATFWRRNVVNEIGYFDENLNYALDYDYWLRISKKYPIRILPIYLAAFRLYQGSKSGNSFLEQFEEELNVAKRYSNGFRLNLHKIHRWLITKTYKIIMKSRSFNN